MNEPKNSRLVIHEYLSILHYALHLCYNNSFAFHLIIINFQDKHYKLVGLLLMYIFFIKLPFLLSLFSL